MKKTVTCRSTLLALSFSLILPQMPSLSFAAPEPETKNNFFDLFPEDKDQKADASKDGSKKDDTGLFPTLPSTGSRTGTRSNSSTSQTDSDKKLTMKAAKVPEAYACPLFENRPHAELIEAIDSLSAAVKVSPECDKATSVQTIEEQSKKLKENVTALSGLLDADPSSISATAIDANVTTALMAIKNLGDVLNNNAFLSSSCGRQSMSSGKALLAFNDMVNGFAPYALFAVAANAALAPALPAVVGGTVLTTGISVISKMIDQNTLDMSKPEHRQALLQNTCQFVNVAKKVRFMQLAQSGKIDKVNEELEETILVYQKELTRPSVELTSLLAYRQKVSSNLSVIENQLRNDKADMDTVNSQIKINNDDLMVCTMARELVKWAKDGKTFPASTFNNLELAAAQGSRSLKLQSVTLTNVNLSSMKRITEASESTVNKDEALITCAQIGKTWITSMNQAIALVSHDLAISKAALENELSQSAEYREFKARYARIQMEKITVKRVEKAMQDLAKDTSIIDRSELAQRMVLLKSALFGNRKTFAFGVAPVLAWINHTKDMHDQAISAYILNMEALKSGSYSLTKTGRTQFNFQPNKTNRYYPNGKDIVDDSKLSANLAMFTLKNFPQGSRLNDLACQQLESAWLDYAAALDHLGAIQSFCKMIDKVLDPKVDVNLAMACRGSVEFNGRVTSLSLAEGARANLGKKGYAADAKIVGQKLKDLRCPTPAVSVMNE